MKHTLLALTLSGALISSGAAFAQSGSSGGGASSTPNSGSSGAGAQTGQSGTSGSGSQGGNTGGQSSGSQGSSGQGSSGQMDNGTNGGNSNSSNSQNQNQNKKHKNKKNSTNDPNNPNSTTNPNTTTSPNSGTTPRRSSSRSGRAQPESAHFFLPGFLRHYFLLYFSLELPTSNRQHRSTSATLQACAMHPRGVCGASASNTSLIDPTQAWFRCGTNPSRKTRALVILRIQPQPRVDIRSNQPGPHRPLVVRRIA